MAREGGFHRDVGRLLVTDFSNHHDVRRLTQDRAERRREVEADVFVHLHLVDAAHLVFDRVLDRDELLVRRVDLSETGVKGRRLARARRAGDEHDAVRELDETFERRLVVRQEAELRQTERRVYVITLDNEEAAQALCRENISVLEVDGRIVKVAVYRDLRSLLAILVNYPVSTLDNVGQSLEEIFMHYYGGEEE